MLGEGANVDEDREVKNAGGHARTDTVRLHEAEPGRGEAVFRDLADVQAGINGLEEFRGKRTFSASLGGYVPL